MYKAVIGLEVHCEIQTNSKVFSHATNEYSELPNINVAEVDLGLPGVMPVPNKEAVRKALKTAMALNCENPDEVIFDRKNYFYPDLPKGYQITQVTKPMGINGYLMIKLKDYEKRIDIHQLHLEEDTASLDHYNAFSLIDYNRSGIPLMEIVTEPCISSADEAVSFLETLRNVFLYLGVSEADSKKGQMRCDVNISLMKDTDSEFGTKVEMKNINAFSSVRSAIEYEIKRQTKLLENGEKVVQETRRYDDEDGKTYSMREKVDAIDYRYFIEPNIPPVKLSKEYLDEIRSEIPKLQLDRLKTYMKDYELSEYDATILVKEKNISDYFDEVMSYGPKAKFAADWVITVVLGSLNKLEITLDEFFITPKMLAEVIKLIDEDKLSLNHGKKIVYQAIADKKDPMELIKESNLEQISDDKVILEMVITSLDENPDVVKQYVEEGKDYVANFFVGQVMKKSKGQANPTLTKNIIKEQLEKRKENERK